MKPVPKLAAVAAVLVAAVLVGSLYDDEPKTAGERVREEPTPSTLTTTPPPAVLSSPVTEEELRGLPDIEVPTTTTTTRPWDFTDEPNLSIVQHPPFRSDFARICDPLEEDRYLKPAVLALCPDVVRAGYEDGDHGDRDSVVHLLYVFGAESNGDPLLNGANWGCPRQEAIAALHPDPEGTVADGRPTCPYYQNRVPIGPGSHMAHTLEERSERLLGYLIDPYDPYEAALLAFALVDEKGVGRGWTHWWHVHWGLNPYLERAGIRGVYFTYPPGEYWTRVRGGYQKAPWLP